MDRRAIKRKDGAVVPMNHVSFESFEEDIQFTLVNFLFDAVSVETVEGINLALRQLAERLNLNEYPIVDPVSGRFIWGFDPIRIDFTSGVLHVEYLHRKK